MQEPEQLESPVPPPLPLPPERGPRRTDGRTWELELLISGAVTYGLLQLPSAVDAWYQRADATSAGAMAEVVHYLYAYIKVILYALIAGFLLHLTARAYWVALIGLDSVFPRGVRWDRLNYGPITSAVYRERQPPLRSLIRKVDRVSSVILSSAFLLVLIFAASILLGAAIGVVSLVVSRLFFGGENGETIFQILLWSVLGVGAVLPLVDRALQARVSPEHGVGRVLDRLTRGYHSLLFGTASFPLVNILLSNFNRRIANALMGAVIACLFAVFFIRDVALPRGRVALDGFEFFPRDPGSLGLDARHYDNQRTGRERSRPVPSIQADIVRDPFVRLFVPYIPDRHNDVIRERCPGVRPFQRTGLRFPERNPAPPPAAAMDAVLSCFAALHRIRLNGEALEPRFRFFVHPGTGQHGVVAYLPVTTLPAGENLLAVEEVPGARAREEGEPAGSFYIPFWVGR